MIRKHKYRKIIAIEVDPSHEREDPTVGDSRHLVIQVLSWELPPLY